MDHETAGNALGKRKQSGEEDTCESKKIRTEEENGHDRPT
ncbi:unnamed protein product, partial [Allacma fusca]